MANCLKKLLCCSHDGTTDGVHQGLQNPPSGPLQSQPSGSPQSTPTAPSTLQDRIKVFKETADTWNIDALIEAIDQLLKSKLNPASTSTPNTLSGSTDLIPNWTSAVGSGTTFLKFVNEHTEKIHAKDDFFQSGQGKKVVEEILQQLGQLHWIVGGLSIIAYVLNKVEKGSQNRSECLQLLKSMFDLANQIKKLNDQLRGEEVKLRDAFVLIVEGCMACASQLHSGKFFRFLKSSVDWEALNNLSSRINRLYQDLTLTTVTEIQATVTAIQTTGTEMQAIVTKTQTTGTEIQATVTEMQATGTKIQATVTEIQTTVTEIKREQPVVVPVLLPAYPEGAVGLDKPLEELKLKLDLQTEVSSRVVVIYGVGGIGKTTLANALVVTVAEDLKYHKYNYTKVEINEDSLNNDFKSMQQQILQDCFPTYQYGRQILVRNCEDGRNHIREAINREKEKPEELKSRVFILIDNALRAKDLKELLPEDLQGFPPRSRILVTTRNLAVTDFFENGGIPRHDHAVKTLAEDDSLQILCEDSTHLNQISSHVKRITQIACGIPLVLKIVGAHLRKQKYKVENCSQILDALEHGVDVKEEDLSERLVHFVYNGFELSTKEAFLDICSFLNGWTRRRVEYIVGVEEVTSLADAALVTFVNSYHEYKGKPIYCTGEEKVIVHDVIQAKGRSMGEATRIKDWSRAAKCPVIKGIELGDQDIEIEESQLSRMSDSLRILSLGDGIRISARSSQTFKELKYFRLGGDIRCFPMNLEGLPCLSVYEGPLLEEVVRKLPPNLKYLKTRRHSYSDAERGCLKESKSIQAVRNSSLEELYLSYVENMQLMFDGKLHFDALKILSLQGWGQMEELPPQVCGLPSLNKLILRWCRSLKRVPDSIANLRALTHLDLSECDELKEVSSSLGELTALRYLDLSRCKALVELPDNFGQLSALEYLSLYECYSLIELGGDFAQLRSLKAVNLSGCMGLKKLPSNFVQLQSLEVLWVRGVDRLLYLFDQKDNTWEIIY